MQEILTGPFAQSSVAPFGVALIVAAALYPLRMSSLAAAAGFLATVWLVGNFALSPLTASRKIVMVAAASPLLGLLADFAFKPTRVTAPVLGVLVGAASLWVFWPVLAQKPSAEIALWSAGVFAFTSITVALAVLLHAAPVRAGAAGFGFGIGAGTSAVLAASALLGQYGLALGAACSAFLLAVMLLGPRVTAGVTFTLSFAATGALIAIGATLLAQLPWTALPALALVPLAARLPLPARSPIWPQALVACIYTLAAAGMACAVTWWSGRVTTL